MTANENPIESYPKVGWEQLEKMNEGTCPCCGKEFSEKNRSDLAAKCHLGPLFVAYWNGFLYFTCSTCNKPVCRVLVSMGGS